MNLLSTLINKDILPRNLMMHKYIKGSDKMDDYVVQMLRIPNKSTVHILQTIDGWIPAFDYIGGHSFRSKGDTCRMFFHVRNEIESKFYFWDGIVLDNMVNRLNDNTNRVKFLYEHIQNHFSEVMSIVSGFGVIQQDFGMVTGELSYRTVLIEKQKRLPE